MEIKANPGCYQKKPLPLQGYGRTHCIFCLVNTHRINIRIKNNPFYSSVQACKKQKLFLFSPFMHQHRQLGKSRQSPANCSFYHFTVFKIASVFLFYPGGVMFKSFLTCLTFHPSCILILSRFSIIYNSPSIIKQGKS